MFNKIDTFVLACHQTIINKTQCRQKDLMLLSAKLLVVLHLIRAMMFGYSGWGAVFTVIAAIVVFLSIYLLASVCPEQGMNDRVTRGISWVYLAFCLLGLWAMIDETTVRGAISTCRDIVTMTVFFFLRCGKPKPPEKKHEVKLATQLN